MEDKDKKLKEQEELLKAVSEPKKEEKEGTPVTSQSLLKELQNLQGERDSAQSKDQWLTLAKGLLDASAQFSAANPYSDKNRVIETKMPTNIGMSQYEQKRGELMDQLRSTAQLEQAQEQRKYRQDMIDAQNLRADKALKAKVTERKAKQEAKDAAPTEGEKVQDREFAKQYQDFLKTEGDIKINRGKLNDIVKKLEKGDLDTGALAGIKTAAAERAGILTEEAEAKTQVRSAIQGMLRPILGGQFAAIEGENIINTAFDPRRSTEENIRALKDEIRKLDLRVKGFKDQAKYFRDNRTLRGYTPKDTVIEDSVIIEAPNGQRKRVKKSAAQKYIDKGGKIVR